MAQRKETKEKVKVRDLKPKKDAKGGVAVTRPGRGDAPGVRLLPGPPVKQ